MKKLLVLVMIVLSVNSFAATQTVKISNLYGSVSMILNEKEIPLVGGMDTRSGLYGREEGLFIVIRDLKHNLEERIQIGDMKEYTNNGGIFVSEDIKANIIKNDEKKRFEASVCSHIGCFFRPHFESTYTQLIEFQGMDGQIICYNYQAIPNKEAFSIGKCSK